jgi:hypothetical protein
MAAAPLPNLQDNTRSGRHWQPGARPWGRRIGSLRLRLREKQFTQILFCGILDMLWYLKRAQCKLHF